VDRAILHARGHPRRTAADDEDGFAESGVDRIHGHEVAALGLAAGIDRPRDQQFVADETLVLPRRDDGPNDLGQNHYSPGGFAPPDPLSRSLAGPRVAARSVRVARS